MLVKQEVARVQFLQSPSDPRFKGYTAVVDFILRKYDYGGYVLLEGMQNFIYNSGDYDIAMKLSKKKMTYRAIAETSYRNADGIVTDKNTTYTYLDGHQLNRKSWADSEDSQRNYTGGVSMRYDSKKLIWILQTGIRFGNSPTNTSKNRLLYDDKTSSESEDATYAQSLVPYVNYSFYIYELPRKSRLVGNLSFSYNHNKSSSHYSFDAPQPGNIFNGYIVDRLKIVSIEIFWKVINL